MEGTQIDIVGKGGSCIEDCMVHILVDHGKASYVQAFGAE